MRLPNYALEIPEDMRIKYHCRARCNRTAYGKLNSTKVEASKKLKSLQAKENEERIHIYVTCGKCGNEQKDYYNWGNEFFGAT